MIVLKTSDGRYLDQIGGGSAPIWTRSKNEAAKFLNEYFAACVKRYLKYTWNVETEMET